MSNNKAKVVTFYSYKGGSGRSTTLINTASHLVEKFGASPEKPILIIDADLESSGLTYLFGCATKFTGSFRDTIHTEKIINEAANMLTGITGDHIFGNSRETRIDFRSIIPKLEALFPKYNIASLFGNVKLSRTNMNLFGEIIGGHGNETYKPVQLIDKLIDISETYRTDEAKCIEMKTRAIEDFLPATSFVDVSEFFGLAPNTVRFLGTDTGNTEERQVVSNSGARVIAKLAKECGHRGYCAVIFDSASGIQSTAHMLHSASDSIVCCMRPTLQFVQGTRMQLYKYRKNLLNILEDKLDSEGGQGKKPVVILPTAVPYEKDDDVFLRKRNFELISHIISDFEDVADGSFCTYETCLNEVSLFKWREQILGVKMPIKADAALAEHLRIYEKYDDKMPKDARRAYEVYDALATWIKNNA